MKAALSPHLKKHGNYLSDMNYQSILKSDCFENNTIIVTGGGSGIGRCTAHELSALGAKVMLIGRTAEKLESTCEEIRQDGGQADIFPLDIRQEDAVAENVREILSRHGQIHGLVNNAGGQYPSPLEMIKQKGFEAVVRTNLVGGFLMSREVYTQCMKKNGGAIVNITADNLNGMPGMAHSGAARAGVENLTMTAAWEWGQAGVRINAVAPGWVASSGFDTYDKSLHHFIRNMKSNVPLKRLASESEISSVICFLLSPAASFITGVTLRVDGGSSLASTAAAWPLPPGDATNSKGFNGFHRYQLPKVLQESD